MREENRPMLDTAIIEEIIRHYRAVLNHQPQTQSLLKILRDATILLNDYYYNKNTNITFKLNLALRQLGEKLETDAMIWVYSDPLLLEHHDIATHTIVIQHAGRHGVIQHAGYQKLAELIRTAVDRAIRSPKALDGAFLNMFKLSIPKLPEFDRLDIVRRALATAFLCGKAEAAYAFKQTILEYGMLFDDMTNALYDLLDNNEALRAPTLELLTTMLSEEPLNQNQVDALYWLASFVRITLPWRHDPYIAQQNFEIGTTPADSSLFAFFPTPPASVDGLAEEEPGKLFSI